MLIINLGIWEEDNIDIDNGITSVIYTDIKRTRLANNKDDASKYEGAPEPALDVSSDERGGVEVVEAEVVDFIDNYKNYEY